MAHRDIVGAVDFAHLETYAAGDQGLVDEVLAMFREQAELWMRLIDPEAPDGFRDGAHTLKGASLGVGAFALAKACEAAELGASADLVRRTVLAGQVRDALDAALADIAAYVHEQALRSLKS